MPQILTYDVMFQAIRALTFPNSEIYLKWDGGGGGVIKESFQKHLKVGGG